jgi:DNA repair protein RadC
MTGDAPGKTPVSALETLAGTAISPGSSELRNHLQATLGMLAHEALDVLFLGQGDILIAHERLLLGSAQRLQFEPKFIFRRALSLGACAVILAHNHPSGDDRPSAEDVTATQWLVHLGQMLGIEIAEHLIVARHGCHAMLQTPKMSKSTAFAHFFDLKDNAACCRHDDGRVCPTAAANARLAAWHRNRRRELIGQLSLLANPAWDMLIDLFLHAECGKQVSISALCFGSCLPMSTALRHVRKLCDSGLVTRQIDPLDGRRSLVALSNHAFDRLNEYFCSSANFSYKYNVINFRFNPATW